MAQERVDWLVRRMNNAFGGGGWSVSISRSVAGLNAADAAWQSRENSHSIWQIVNHVTFWKEVCAEALTGASRRQGRIVNADTFGAPGDPADHNGWQEALARLHRAQGAMVEAMGGRQDGDLDQPLPGEQTPVGDLVAGLIEHDAYHAGQIVTIRRIQGSWSAQD